jgi:hypothetical protein
MAASKTEHYITSFLISCNGYKSSKDGINANDYLEEIRVTIMTIFKILSGDKNENPLLTCVLRFTRSLSSITRTYLYAITPSFYRELFKKTPSFYDNLLSNLCLPK